MAVTYTTGRSTARARNRALARETLERLDWDFGAETISLRVALGNVSYFGDVQRDKSMFEALRHRVREFVGDRRGNVAILAAAALPVLAGSLGFGAEVASWHSGKRALQNAADSAAIAAATNASSNGYDDEARAVAARYGFQDGTGGVTVVSSNTAPCPGGGECYRVTVSRPQRLFFAQVVGFVGDTILDGSPAMILSATALAKQANAPHEYCILALASSGASNGIRSNGAPNADLTGCSVMSNTNSDCNGHDLKADFGAAHGTNSGCGRKRMSDVPTVADPYESLKANIPTDPCGSYHRAPVTKKDSPLPSTNNLHGIEVRSVINMCGDVELTGPVLIRSSGNGTVLIVRNGSLNLKGYTLQTLEGSALTIIFTGTDNARDHRPVGDGMFDIGAPKAGPWRGVALYQDPRMTGGVDISEAGNKPAWQITGLVYLPHASVTFSGVVNKASNGASCFGLVVDNLRINGTGEILAHGECARAGLILPASLMPSRGELVS